MSNIKTNNTAFHGPLRFILLHQCNKIYNKKKDPRGRPRRFTLDYIIDRIMYILKTGCPWSMLPVEGGSYKTIFAWYNRFSKANIFEHAFHDLVKWYQRVQKRSNYLVDTSFVKNQYGRDCLGKNPTDRGRKATKVSLLTDGVGTPIEMAFHPANKHDCRTLDHILAKAHQRKKLIQHQNLYADKGYDSQHCRDLTRSVGLTPCISKTKGALQS